MRVESRREIAPSQNDKLGIGGGARAARTEPIAMECSETHHVSEKRGYTAPRLLRSRSGFGILAVFATFVISLVCAVGSAQSTSGTILGNLADQSGAVLAATQIKLTDIDKGDTRTTLTNASGHYSFVNIPPGSYRISVQKQGFKQLVREPIALQVASTIQIDLTMTLGDVSQEVVVTGSSPLIQAETTSLGGVIDERETVEMPLNGRNPMNLTALVPSVVPQGGAMQNPTGINPFSWGNYQIGGGMANQSAQYLDGSPLNTEYVNGIALIPTQDSLQEFKVETNNLSPEYGHMAGGAVNFRTKSGTKDLHGSAWEYLRNKVLNANTYYGNQAGLPRPSFTQNQYGLNLGGPVLIPRVYDGRRKTFFFVNWEGFALRQGQTFVETVPTSDELNGNLSALGVPIYDPLSTCGLPGGPVCGIGASQYDRTEFANADISSKLNPTAVAWLKAFYPAPNTAGSNGQNNFVHNASVGGNNYQTVVHIDHDISEKQHISSRYSNWMLKNLPINPYGTGLCNGQCLEHYNTNDFVLDDTYSFNNTTILDLRISYMRFVYTRVPSDPTFNVTDIGWPASLQAQTQFPGPPLMVISGNDIDGSVASQGSDSVIFNATDDDRIAGTLTKLMRSHTLILGGEFLRATWNYAQGNLSDGEFFFNNSFTAQNPLTGIGGAGLASYLLGYAGSGSATNDQATAAEQLYPALFITDHWRATPRLTLDIGLRWEDNFPFTERHDLQSYFDFTAVNPLLAAANISTYPGSIELVNSSTRSSRYAANNHVKQFSPRVGLTYAIRPSTVLSMGYGIFWIPVDVSDNTGPQGDPINLFNTIYNASVNGGLTPANNLSNPFPQGGIIAAPGRNPAFQSDLLGLPIGPTFPNNPYAYAQQWNAGIQQQIGNSFAVTVAYGGAKGTHLPFWSINVNQLPDADLQQGNALLNPVANPFSGIINPLYSLGASTIPAGQLLLKYPQYAAVNSNSAALAASTYNSMQISAQKRFARGASLNAAYTFAKFISNTDTLTAWLEPGTAGAYGAVQDNNNLRAEKSLSSNDTRQRLVLSYVYDIPVGRGMRFLSHASGLENQIVGGWGLGGVTTLMAGFPLGFATNQNLTNSFGGGSRPNYAPGAPGCNSKKTTSGGAVSRLNAWFNTACFTQPDAFTYGNESRNDAQLRAPGMANWDSSLFKNFPIKGDGKASVQFRTEVFNLFNRVQFGYPGTTQGTGNFGVIGSQLNLPRILQFSLRVNY